MLYVSVFFMLVFNFFLNYNFFPSLMKYQGGNELAFKMERENSSISDKNIILLETGAHSFDFYRGYNHEIIEKNELGAKLPLNDKYFLLTSFMARRLPADSFRVEPIISHIDYNITTLKLKFLNPKTRLSNCDTLMLAKIYPQ